MKYSNLGMWDPLVNPDYVLPSINTKLHLLNKDINLEIPLDLETQKKASNVIDRSDEVRILSYNL
jgi:hypothetical protein